MQFGLECKGLDDPSGLGFWVGVSRTASFEFKDLGPRALGFRVYSLGFGGSGLRGFRGLRFRVENLGFLGFQVEDFRSYP